MPKGIEVKVAGDQLTVKGPKGTLSRELPKGISVKIEGDLLFVSRDESVEMPRTTHGLMRALINNMIIGTHKGFEVKLSLIGVGYRANIVGQKLDLQLGYSHPTQLDIPKNVQVAVDKSVTISITGIDKQAVGAFAAEVRGMKPPEPYKGKGVRYENEVVRKKDGKAAKGKAGA